MIPAITSHQITTNTISSNDEMRNRKCLNNKTFYSTYRGVSDGSNEIMFEEGHYKVKYTILIVEWICRLSNNILVIWDFTLIPTMTCTCT